MATKLLTLCKANINRSVLAKHLLEEELRKRGLENECTVNSAGIKRVPKDRFLDVYSYMNAALRNTGHGEVSKSHVPKFLQREYAIESDIVFVMDHSICDALRNRWSDLPGMKEKLHVLPEYSFGKETELEIFDPQSLLISPLERFSDAHTLTKKATLAFLKVFRNRWAGKIVNSLTPYVPSTSRADYRNETIGLYERSIRLIEPCIPVAVDRLIKEGYLPH